MVVTQRGRVLEGQLQVLVLSEWSLSNVQGESLCGIFGGVWVWGGGNTTYVHANAYYRVHKCMCVKGQLVTKLENYSI